MADSEFYADLAPGTELRNRQTGQRIRVNESRGDWFSLCHIRKDHYQDMRYRGWSGSLRRDTWRITFGGEGTKWKEKATPPRSASDREEP